MIIELIKENEVQETCEMMERACRQSSLADFYPEGYIDDLVKSGNTEFIMGRMKWTHFYVMKENDAVIGCGAIGAYWDSLTESCLFTIFVDPKYQGRGYGKRLIETLENDEFGLRAQTIYVHSALSAIPFYKKMGYSHKNGELNYEGGHFELEKKMTRV